MEPPLKESLPEWLHAVAAMFEVDVSELRSLANVLDDPSCWLQSDVLNDTRVIRLAAPLKPGFVGYLVRLPAGAKLPPQARGIASRLLVLRGGFFDYATDRHIKAGETLTRRVDESKGGRIDDGEDCVCAVMVELGDMPKRP